MIKIFDSAIIREIDSATVKDQEITSLELMERAACCFFDAILPLLKAGREVYVFAGPGNNGGDALAIAWMLCCKAFHVKTYLVNPFGKLSSDCEANQRRLSVISNIIEITKTEEIPQIPDGCVVIDGLFGSGLNRPAEGLFKDMIVEINRSVSDVYSIDIPSGMFIDDNGPNISDGIIKADRVFTFQFPKLALLLPDSNPYCNQFDILDIGLSGNSIKKNSTDYYFLEKEDISGLIVPRKKFANKGNFGKAYIFSGSYGKMGAALMCARACLRTGVGLLTMHVPRCGVDILQTGVPEAMVKADIGEQFSMQSDSEIDKYTVGIGPGLGVNNETKQLMFRLLEKYKNPLVIDADALNVIAEEPRLKLMLPPNSILTPHPVEFDRLIGEKSSSGYIRLQNARDFASRHQLYIVLKGAYTAIVTPEKTVFFNSTGNPGMATGGSGDVLTGVLTSLLAQGYSPLNVCLLGVYLHGLAGDLAAMTWPQESLLATDIIDFIGKAYHNLQDECLSNK